LVLGNLQIRKYRNGEKAVELANKTCELSDWKDWSYLETLAVAQAETGNFDDAIESIKKAKDLAPDFDQAELDEILAVFESGQPFRSRTGKNSESKLGD
jgi:Flp pilus assembly protein TadD